MSKIRVTAKQFAEFIGADYVQASNVVNFLATQGIANQVDKVTSQSGRGKPSLVYEIPTTFTITLKKAEVKPAEVVVEPLVTTVVEPLVTTVVEPLVTTTGEDPVTADDDDAAYQASLAAYTKLYESTEGEKTDAEQHQDQNEDVVA